MSAERGRRRRDVRYVIISHSHASSVTHTTHTKGASTGVGPSLCQNYATRVSLSRPLGRLPAAPSTIPAAGLVDFVCHCFRSFAQKRSQRAPRSHTFCTEALAAGASLTHLAPLRLLQHRNALLAGEAAKGAPAPVGPPRHFRRADGTGLTHGPPASWRAPPALGLPFTDVWYIGESSGDMTSP